MSKLVMAFMVGLVILNLLSAFMDGGGGMCTTQLTNDMSITDTVANVASTDGFLTTDELVIQDEHLLYTSINATAFLGLTRGYDSTDNATHNAGRKVFTESTDALNTALGFNAGAIAATQGTAALVIIPWKFFTITLPRMILWDYTFMQGDLLGIVQYIMIAISLTVFVIFAIQFYQLIKPK